MTKILLEILIVIAAVIGGIAAIIGGGKFMIWRRETNAEEKERTLRLKRFYERAAKEQPIKNKT